MKILKKILIILLILVVLILITGGLFIRNIARKALPDYNQTLVIEGLHDEVMIYRDQHAIPHIYADNEHDLYLATGYVMAQERLWQMDLLRRATMGRLSEIFGKDMVDADHLLRALRITEKSELVLSRCDEQAVAALEAFSLGVNHYINQYERSLPPEFTILGYKPEPWQPIHSINLIGYMAWDLKGSWNTEIFLHKLRPLLEEEKFLELLPNPENHQEFVFPEFSMDVPADLTQQSASSEEYHMIIPGEPENMFTLLENSSLLQGLGLEVFSGSNSWVVSGEYTETGLPLFANDMHLSFGAPGIWIQIQQVVKGKLNVTGVALPGQPFVIVGHNENIAWGMTNLYVDEMDFYLETIDPVHPDNYLFNGDWKQMEVRHERIAFKGGDTIERINRFSHRGPIISGFKSIDDQAISMRWTGNEYSNEIQSIYLLNKAANWNEFRHALSYFGAVSQNVTYADVNGNIGQQTIGGVPLRRQGDGKFIYPGDTDLYDWKGILSFNELPYEFNPDRGMVSAANNRTVDESYPYLIGHWYDMPYRISRIREMLAERESFTAADFIKMMTDAHSVLAERNVPKVTKIVGAADDLSQNEQKALQKLSEWDFVYSTESIAAMVFEQFYHLFVKNIMIDEVGEELYRELNTVFIRNMYDQIWRNPGSDWITNIHTPQTETFEDMVMLSFRETIGLLETKLGPDPDKWEWGRLQQLKVSHPMGSVKMLARIFGLNRGPYPVPGSFHTVANNSYSFHDPFNVYHGASQRHIFNLADWSDNHVVIPTGTSGIPASSYYLNQLDTYLKGEFHSKPWTKEDVINAARYSMTLSPGP